MRSHKEMKERKIENKNQDWLGSILYSMKAPTRSPLLSCLLLICLPFILEWIFQRLFLSSSTVFLEETISYGNIPCPAEKPVFDEYVVQSNNYVSQAVIKALPKIKITPSVLLTCKDILPMDTIFNWHYLKN